MMMSAVMPDPSLMLVQLRPDWAESWAKVLSVSYGGLPVGVNEAPWTDTDCSEDTVRPATLVPPPHASLPLMTPVPFLSTPEKLTSAPSTFIVVLFQRTSTPTVRVAFTVLPKPAKVVLL